MGNSVSDTHGFSRKDYDKLKISSDELVEKLDATANKPISVGFAVGAYERRIRGKINAIKAPIWSEAIILGFIVD